LNEIKRIDIALKGNMLSSFSGISKLEITRASTPRHLALGNPLGGGID